jgi:hypothetical protein
LSPSGPSTSIAIDLPSAGKLWQFAQVGMSRITMRLSSRDTSFRRHWISGWADDRAAMTPSFEADGINGTSR